MKKILIICLLLTGCYNYTELNNLAITTGIAVDYIDDEFEVTILISNSQKISTDSQTSASSAVYSGRGKTIFEAIKDTSMSISKQIYLSHIEVLVISEEVAKDKLQETIDFFFRYPQTRNEFLVVLAENCLAKDTFLVTTPLETFPSQNISKNLEITNKLQGYTYTVKLNEFIKNVIEEGKNPVVPTISIIGNVEEGNKDKNIEQNKPTTYLKLGMLAIFKNYHLVKIVNKDQSAGINIINNKIKTSLLPIKYDDKNIVIELINLKSKISVDDTHNFKISINTNGSIEEVSDNIDINNAEIIDKIKEKAIEEIKRITNEAIKLSKDTNTDIFGLGNVIYKNNPKYWKQIKDKWEDEILEKTNFEIDVNIQLKTKGKINYTIEVNK